MSSPKKVSETGEQEKKKGVLDNMSEKLPLRSEVKTEDTWRLEDYFPTDG